MMTRYASLFFASALALVSRAQVQNALDCDGVDDKVTVPAASSLITTGTGISLGCWAYPTNTFPGYPDFDGFAGMRNEFDADFYLLQVSPSNVVEGRFRNSAGEAFTLEYSDLQLNTWQFLVMTYDGSQLTIYADGVNVATAPANGAISSTTTDLLIGDVHYQEGVEFSLDGKVDEVSLWNRGLSQSEVECMYSSGVDVAANGLQLYYKMDQGIANGTNTAITTLTDSKGNINGSLDNFALTGATSNFVAGPAVGNSITANICQGSSYTFNGLDLTEPGTYTASYDIGEICDSLVTLILTNSTVNVGVVQVGQNLTALAQLGPYKWYDCNAQTVIAGATQQTYHATANGAYAFIYTQNGCTDTSACYTVTTAGIEELPSLSAHIYPDPAKDHVRIELGATAARLDMAVCDMNGREVMRNEYRQVANVDLSLGALNTGVYFLRLSTGTKQGVFRLVKE